MRACAIWMQLETTWDGVSPSEHDLQNVVSPDLDQRRENGSVRPPVLLFMMSSRLGAMKKQWQGQKTDSRWVFSINHWAAVYLAPVTSLKRAVHAILYNLLGEEKTQKNTRRTSCSCLLVVKWMNESLPVLAVCPLLTSKLCNSNKSRWTWPGVFIFEEGERQEKKTGQKRWPSWEKV